MAKKSGARKQLTFVYVVSTPTTDDQEAEAQAAFTTEAKALSYIRKEFDPELPEDEKPYIYTLTLNPTTKQREYVTVWHTCVGVLNEEFGEMGVPTRHDASDLLARDREEVVPTAFDDYANVYSRKSAKDSIKRAVALARQHKN